MKAIILAAGKGERLYPLTATRPKCLVPFRGRPLIDYLLEAMQTCGIDDIVAVSGYREADLRRHVDSRGVIVCNNADYDTTNMVHSLFCASEFMTDDLIISYADIVYVPSVLKKLIDAPNEVSVVVDRDWKTLWDLRMDDPLSDAETMQINGDGYITSLGQKPTEYSQIQGQYIGLIKFPRRLLGTIKDFYHSLPKKDLYDGRSLRQMYFTTFLQLIINQLAPIRAIDIHGGWAEVDSVEDLSRYEVYLRNHPDWLVERPADQCA